MYANLYDFWALGEEAEQNGRAEKDEAAHDNCGEGLHEDHRACSLLDAVRTTGTEVLTDKGGGSDTEGLVDHPPEGIELAVGGPGGNRIYPHGIYRTLYHHVGDTEHAVCDGGRKSDLQDAEQSSGVDVQAADAKLHAGCSSGQEVGNHGSGEGLTEVCRDGGTQDAHMKDHNEDKV